MNKISNFGTFTLLFVSSLTIMVGTVIAPSLGEITKQLDFQFNPGWLLTLPSLGVVVFAALIGKVVNRIGAYKLLGFGLIPYAVFGFSGAFISDSYLLLLNRFLLGGAAVAIQVSVTTLIAEYFQGKSRMKMIAWQGMSIELGGVLFLSVGGMLGELHWQLPFAIYLIGIVCFFMVRFSLSDAKPLADAQKVTSPVESSNNSSLVSLICFGSLFAMILFFVSFVRLPQFLPEVFQFSESYTGYYMAFISFVAVLSASQMPKVEHRFGAGATVALGFLLFALGYTTFALGTSLLGLFLAAIFVGTGFGFTVPLLNHMMVEISTPENQGKNLGLYSMFIFGGQFLSTFIEFLSNDARVLFSIASAMSLVVAVVLYFLFKRNQVMSK